MGQIVRQIVLGIDPGVTRLGYGVVEASGSTYRALTGGTITTDPALRIPARLRAIEQGLEAVLEKWRPDSVAVERVFLNRNSKTAVPAIQAAGIALVASARAGIEVEEYSPAEVKMALTGTGTATKKQVHFMAQKILRPSYEFDSDDSGDAHAVAICHLNSRKMRMVSAK